MIPRIAVTSVCLLLYLVGLRVPLPLVDSNALSEVSQLVDFAVPTASFLHLGLAPFLTGFVLVELFSLMTPPGRRLRADGVSGRSKLNRAGLGVSALIALLQAAGIAHFLAATTTPGGASISSAPVWLLAITLAAGTFIAAGLAEAISRYGLGNGYAILFVAPLVPALLSTLHRLSVDPPSGEPGANIMSIVWMLLFATLIVTFVGRRPEARVITAEGASLAYRMPPLPQGIVPLAWSYSVGNQMLSWGIDRMLQSELGFESPPRFFVVLLRSHLAYLAFLAATIVLFSLVAAWMFTARKRLESNLEGVATVPAEPYDRLWLQGLVLGTVVLAGGGAGLAALRDVVPAVDTSVLPLLTLLPLAAVALDLVDEARLSAKGPLERVLTLDNVHLAELLRARLAEQEIEAVVTCFRYRRLSYFFGPLFKMGLLVPAADRERAERLVEETPFRIV